MEPRKALRGSAVSRCLIPVVISLLALFALSPTVAAANFDPPKHYYLALGDSLAFGAQLGKFFQEVGSGTYDPATFNTGYVDRFAARLRSIDLDERARVRSDRDRQIETVNLSCPGETTASYSATCIFKALGFSLHTSYPGSQESAALAFLRSHRGQVSPITIDLGLNDAQLPCASPTFSVDVACFRATMPAALQSVAANLPRILDELHAASPSSEIIVMTFYNPFFVVDQSTDALVQSMNGEIAGIASARNLRVADVFSAFNRTGDERSTLCALTLYCTPPLNDEHPSDAGYGVMADRFWDASGYSRLND